ncbi:MAG: DEAD/DEAH box helicase family protein [Phycisphaerales bacterium]|nr:DEAD/DEAH box helicase family protein [Phycisphaerales bacterium]
MSSPSHGPTFTSTFPKVNMISNRLSLRDPQRVSLDILARLCDVLPLDKTNSPEELAAALAAVKAEFPQNSNFADFERDFPSLCFALATGVGKTRLMGAFIAYLHLVEGIRHFFVLAPNLTIYNKLIADFTPGNAKYVFQGISEFVTNPPEIITGDNYESGRGIRAEAAVDSAAASGSTTGMSSSFALRGDIQIRQQRLFGAMTEGAIHINIFNISKINSEVRGGKEPRIKRLQEYIGESYFEYLSKLPDLVLLMDESHRYRASAGVKAINELKPILGLELTATPQVESAKGAVPFKNVIYSYPLSLALKDGFVKQPAVATRQNFDKKNYDEKGLEKLKLEDGIRIHEDTKVHLTAYAVQAGVRYVKPFVLVVAKNVEHAEELRKTIEADDFFQGQYKGKAIVVHSEQGAAEKDETVQKLLEVERADNPVEIVIHVNMLKEGWDVTNLYTIVPLRTADSRTLVEQSIGRGLRLPYGRRVGVPAVDRLTIVAHDRFQEIVDEANKADSLLKSKFEVVYVPEQKSQVVIVETTLANKISLGAEKTPASKDGAKPTQAALFENREEVEAAQATLTVIRQFETLKKSADLTKPEIQKQIAAKVATLVTPAQPTLDGVIAPVDVAKIVAKTTALYIENTIDVPRIVVVPKEGAGDQLGFKDFNLDVKTVRLQPVDDNILMKYLDDNRVEMLARGTGIVEEDRLEDYLVRGLIDFDDVDYSTTSELLYKLAEQMVKHLRSYLPNEEAVKNVLQYHQHQLVNIIHSQMEQHYSDPDETEFEAVVSKGFETLKAGSFTTPADEKVRFFRTPIEDKLYIRSLLFEGFEKCLYTRQKFDSDSERRMSVLLEDDATVLKWCKPPKGQLRIDYKSGEGYEPDFVVETKDKKYLCEPKRATEMNDEIVQAKAKAGAVWCEHASVHAKEQGGKPWEYLLIPHDKIKDNMNLAGLAASCRVLPPAKK